MTVKRFGCTEIHKALYKCLIHSSKQCPVIIISYAVHILKHAVDAFAMRTHQTAYWRLTCQLLLKAFVLQSRCCIVCVLIFCFVAFTR